MLRAHDIREAREFTGKDNDVVGGSYSAEATGLQNAMTRTASSILVNSFIIFSAYEFNTLPSIAAQMRISVFPFIQFINTSGIRILPSACW